MPLRPRTAVEYLNNIYYTHYHHKLVHYALLNSNILISANEFPYRVRSDSETVMTQKHTLWWKRSGPGAGVGDWMVSELNQRKRP